MEKKIERARFKMKGKMNDLIRIINQSGFADTLKNFHSFVD